MFSSVATVILHVKVVIHRGILIATVQMFAASRRAMAVAMDIWTVAQLFQRWPSVVTQVVSLIATTTQIIIAIRGEQLDVKQHREQIKGVADSGRCVLQISSR